MARLIGPDEASRTVFLTAGANKGKAAAQGLSVPLYADQALTVPADVRTAGDAIIPGVPPTLIVDAFSQIPLFKFPDGADVVYTSVSGGPTVALYARTDERIDAATAAAAVAQASADAAASVAAASVSKGSSKGDGQNPFRMRRPTLVVERMYPNEQHDHQIVWIDETLKVAYAIGQDRALRKSTWVTRNDEAISFALRLSKAPTGKSWAGGGLFLRLPSGVLLMSEGDVGHGVTTNMKLLRSTDDGFNWSTVWTATDPVWLLGPQSVARDEVTGYLYLCEYASGPVPTQISIWRSTDDGATWSVWYTYPRAETNATGIIRHWHAARWDPIGQRVYFAAGDTSPDAGIRRVNADGSGVETIITNAQLPQWNTAARTIDFMFFPTHIAWGKDSVDPYVYRMARTEIGKASPVVEQVAELNSSAWWSQRASADGSVWVVCASSETATNRYDDGVHLYVVSNNGADVDEVATANMPTVGAASFSGLAGGNGGGDSFWMRAHNYKVHPHTTYSGMQFRAKVVWGAVPAIVQPEIRRKAYVPETRSWMTALTAGQTLTFSHTRAPFVASTLYILNMGLKVLTGPGTARLQIYNVTTSTELMTWSGGQHWRYDSSQDTTEVFNRVNAAAGDQIEFRLIETSGTGSATVSAFVVTGWGFPVGVS